MPGDPTEVWKQLVKKYGMPKAVDPNEIIGIDFSIDIPNDFEMDEEYTTEMPDDVFIDLKDHCPECLIKLKWINLYLQCPDCKRIYG